MLQLLSNVKIDSLERTTPISTNKIKYVRGFAEPFVVVIEAELNTEYISHPNTKLATKPIKDHDLISEKRNQR